MKQLLLFLIVYSLSSICIAQNVGVGTITPAEKLDVNGNINIQGQVKINGVQGNAQQVLMKDVSNNPVWGDLSGYKNVAVFDCINLYGGTTNNCINTWTVPVGVTDILVEC